MRLLVLLSLLASCDSEQRLTTVVDDVAMAPVGSLEVTPRTLHFSHPVVGDVQSIQVANLGTDDLLIEEIESFLSHDLFSVGDAPLRLLEPGQSTRVPVTWLPAYGQEASGLVVLHTDLLEGGSAEVVVTASAPAPGLCDPVTAPFGGGAGTAADPWRVCDSAHLDAVRAHPADRFEMYDDVDLAGVAFEPIPIFSGVFDGGGYTLSNWTYTTAAEGVSLFVQIDGGHLYDLNVAHFSVSAGPHSSILARTVGVGAVVERIRVTDATLVGSGGFLGGVLGLVNIGGTVSDLFFSGTVTDTSTVGFIGGVMNTCYGTCTNLVAEGRVDGGLGWKVGGIANFIGNDAIISGCAVHMDVHGGSRVGGVVGIMGQGVIENCYVTGTVSGLHWVGGIVGESYSGSVPQIRHSYVRGSVIATAEHAGVGAGELVAWDPVAVVITASAWDTQSTGVSWSAGGDGLSTTELQDPSATLFAMWQAPWVLSAGAYPTLSFE